MNVGAHAVAGIRKIEQDRPIDVGVAEPMLPVERNLLLPFYQDRATRVRGTYTNLHRNREVRCRNSGSPSYVKLIRNRRGVLLQILSDGHLQNKYSGNVWRWNAIEIVFRPRCARAYVRIFGQAND